MTSPHSERLRDAADVIDNEGIALDSTALSEAADEIDRLRALLRWLDEWMGENTLRECSQRIRAALGGRCDRLTVDADKVQGWYDSSDCAAAIRALKDEEK